MNMYVVYAMYCRLGFGDLTLTLCLCLYVPLTPTPDSLCLNVLPLTLINFSLMQESEKAQHNAEGDRQRA